MFPGRIKQDPRVLLLTLLITFISGVSFFAAIMFWRMYHSFRKKTRPPLIIFAATQAFNVYGHNPVMVGLRTFPAGFAIMLGAVIVLFLLSVFRGRNKELMIVSSIIMTAGTAALACVGFSEEGERLESSAVAMLIYQRPLDTTCLLSGVF